MRSLWSKVRQILCFANAHSICSSNNPSKIRDSPFGVQMTLQQELMLNDLHSTLSECEKNIRLLQIELDLQLVVRQRLKDLVDQREEFNGKVLR